MPYAPDLGGAFLNGTGVHGALWPDGRYTDDVWFYDLNTHFLFVAGDSRDNGTMWVYRYKRAAGKE